MKINLLGTNFTLESDENPEYLESVTQYFSKKIDEIKSTVDTEDPIKLAILAGILVVDELYKYKSSTQEPKNTTELEEAERITLALIDKLDSSLEANSFVPTDPTDGKHQL